MEGVTEQLEEVRARLAKVQCGPLPSNDHNIVGVDPHVLSASLVSVMNECSRIVSGLGFSYHRPTWPSEVELEETLSLPVAQAVGFRSTFHLEWKRPIMAQKYMDYPGYQQPTSPPIDPKGDALLHPELAIKHKKKPKVRLLRRRAPPEWDAAYPPVNNVEMLTRPETISEPREFLALPNPRFERPLGERWRHYCHLHGIPYFSTAKLVPSQPVSGDYRLRTFRYPIHAFTLDI